MKITNTKIRESIPSIILVIITTIICSCIPINPVNKMTATPLPEGDSYGPLELTIHLKNKVFHLGEKIEPIATLINKGSNKILIRNKFAVGFNHNEQFVNTEEIFLDSSGKPVRYAGIYVYYVPISDADADAEFQIINPNEEITKEISFLNINYRIFETGKYSYQIIYKNHLDPSDGRKAWKGELTSNLLEFEIIP